MTAVVAPTTSTALYFEVFLLNHSMTIQAGNYAVFVLGVVLLIMSIRKVAVFTSNLVPFVLKVFYSYAFIFKIVVNICIVRLEYVSEWVF